MTAMASHRSIEAAPGARRRVIAYVLSCDNLSIVIPDGSRGACAERVEPGPMYPGVDGVSRRFTYSTGVHGSRLSRLRALGRDDNREAARRIYDPSCGRRLPVAAMGIAVGVIAVAAVLTTAPAGAQSVEDAFKGKTVNLVIGYSVGGGYDLYGRHVARHMGKYIPGRPAIVPQNMTGAGSLRAASYIYSAAPADGTVFGTFGRTMAIQPLLASAPFDGTKFAWLGSVTNDVS